MNIKRIDIPEGGPIPKNAWGRILSPDSIDEHYISVYQVFLAWGKYAGSDEYKVRGRWIDEP